MHSGIFSVNFVHNKGYNIARIFGCIITRESYSVPIELAIELVLSKNLSWKGIVEGIRFFF